MKERLEAKIEIIEFVGIDIIASSIAPQKNGDGEEGTDLIR